MSQYAVYELITSSITVDVSVPIVNNFIITHFYVCAAVWLTDGKVAPVNTDLLCYIRHG